MSWGFQYFAKERNVIECPEELTPPGRDGLLIDTSESKQFRARLFHGDTTSQPNTGWWWAWEFRPDGTVHSEHHERYAHLITPLDLIAVYKAAEWYAERIQKENGNGRR
jgi:hypothetical protein